MEVAQVLHMNGGNGEVSYATNSLVQRMAISVTKPITDEAMVELCSGIAEKTLSIADLGCSSGPNTLMVVSELVETAVKSCNKLDKKTPEFQLYLNDLPGNDFNSIFKSLPKFQTKLKKKTGLGFSSCFLTAVPGSFYGRLFPTKSLHFVHSSYSLMWLSQVPKGIENNKGNIYMSETSPANVLPAYHRQFQRDFSLFLKCRSEELVPGGRMVLTILGRKSDDRSSKECCKIWDLLAMALNEMVAEGLIEEEKMDSFNIPQYSPSPAEVKSEVEKDGSFTINHLEVSTVSWFACGAKLYGLSDGDESERGGYNVAKCMRAVAEGLLASHFGDAIIDEAFQRYRKNLVDCMAKETTEFYNVTVSLTRK
ncbi:S-adenosyl-L-methionine:benzoic acid/salicylic acid carboxyl methyltransferase 3-like [Diospyros lotus]|uniref:S-adenosyl-L-methionine:benzoic acid/salicylic acid carboxyl methyltransferase 3-like n=1 Tax=Diospyros lotus TaxID=55363 RepID=UPI00225AD678|nr:S-adenosyl-L-methionine:benzoic acid/salicylic acid carboxyl methyltransferase 3-like [Diospyros lotus]